MKKNMVAVIATASVLAATVTGYFGSRKMVEPVSAAETTEFETEEKSTNKKDYYVVGISQFSQNPNMDECREGFIEALEKQGFVEGDNLTIRYYNANFNEGKASQISESFVADGVDLIYAIETQSATLAYNSALGTKVPVIYSAMENPLAQDEEEEDTDEEEISPDTENSSDAEDSSEITDSDKKKDNITGLIESADVEGQINMIRKTLPHMSRMGIIYDANNADLDETLAKYKRVAAQEGILVYCSRVDSESDLAEATAELASKTECICLLNDSMITEGIQAILEKASENLTPVFGSTKEQVDLGCTAAVSIDYKKLGEETGNLAVKILLKEKEVTEIPVKEFQTSCVLENLE